MTLGWVMSITVHTCNPGTQEVEAEELKSSSKPLLDNEFITNLGYMIPHLVKTNTKMQCLIDISPPSG